jgi:hypothetical protein
MRALPLILVFCSLVTLDEPSLAQSSGATKVELESLRLTVPASFKEVPDLAVANQIDAPGRFKFQRGRAFYDSTTADIVQFWTSDNPLVGMDHEKAQAMFLKPFGGLTERSWGLDTYSSMFIPWPKQAFEVWGKTAARCLEDKNRKKVAKEMAQFIRPDGKIAFPLFFTTKGPSAIYVGKLTPALLMEIKEGTVSSDLEFVGNDALLGEFVLVRGDNSKWIGQAFRAYAAPRATASEAKMFGLPSSVVGKMPFFWWVMFSDEDTVFEPGKGPLYHVVLATFDEGNPPAVLDSILKSIELAK